MNRLLPFFVFLLFATYSLLPTYHALAESVFFEFAPDAWASARFEASSVVSPLYQLISTTQDVELTGFDLWIDNTGSSGEVRFTLFSETEELMSKTVTVPTLPTLPGGNRFHVNTPTPILLTANQTYSLNIDSDLTGLGLYSADRILMVEHNKNVIGTIGYGTAKIGGELQPFTFKLALYSPTITGSGYNNTNSPVYTDTPNQPSTPTTTVSIAITNARVIETTDTTVTLAWTTNIAADSRVSIRNQLSPLFVVASASDATWELEHAVTVTGLVPNANYFADVFSTQGELVVLTTYTIGFKTQPQSTSSQNAQSSTQSSTQSSSQGNSSTTENNSQGDPQNSSPTLDSSTNNQNSNGATGSSSGNLNSSGSSGINADSTGGINTAISWPAGATTTTGYRIDIFDANYNLERSIKVAAGQTEKNVAGLSGGTHHVVVYQKNADGSFVKVAPGAEIIIVRKEITKKLAVGSSILISIIGGGAYAIRRFKKEKTILPPEEGYDPTKF